MLNRLKKYHLAIWFYTFAGVFTILALVAHYHEHDLALTIAAIVFEYFYFALGTYQLLSVKWREYHVR